MPYHRSEVGRGRRGRRKGRSPCADRRTRSPHASPSS
jgi:hypothetical protein